MSNENETTLQHSTKRSTMTFSLHQYQSRRDKVIYQPGNFLNFPSNSQKELTY